MIIGKHRYNKRFFYALFVLLAVVLVVVMTADFEKRWAEAKIDDLSHDIPGEEQMLEKGEKVAVTTQDDAETHVLLGEFTLTFYCPCEKCCGKSDGVTATGTIATAGRTIAVDPEIIPLGSDVLIDGYVYVAEDVGGAIKGNKIDVFCDSHSEALNRGRITREVFVDGNS